MEFFSLFFCKYSSYIRLVFSSGPGSYFWPGWTMLWWGIGLLFQYLSAYQDNNMFTIKQEYERLKNQ